MRNWHYITCAMLVGAAACERTQGDPVAVYRELPADQIMIDVTHSPTNDGIRSAFGRFDTAYVFQDSSKLHLKGVNLEFFDSTGRKTATLTSRTGELNTQTQAMVARGDVVLITTVDARIIRTQKLHYDPSTRRIWSDLETAMQYQGDNVRADGFSSDDQFSRIEFVGLRGRVPGIKVNF